jgi:hypothetical protein
MRNVLIAAIAGLTVCFAGDFTPQAEAQSWRRGYRQFRQFDRRWDRGRSYRYNRGYYPPRRYYTTRRYYSTPRYYYGYRGYAYPNYGWNRGGVWFRF